MFKKLKYNNNGFSILELAIIIVVVLLIALSAYGLVIRDRNLTKNEAYFQYLNNKVASFDNDLAKNTSSKLSYDPNNYCGHSYASDTNSGPLVCYISRAYYFPALNEDQALSLYKTIVSTFHTSFPSPRYKYPKEIFTYSKYVHNSNGVVYVGQPKAGFSVISGDPLFATDSMSTIDHSGCSYQINWPNEQMYDKSNSGFPIRNNWYSLEFIFNCGAGAAKHYYPSVD